MYSLSDIFGNRNTIEKMSSAVKSGQISHSYIITGSPGTGKTLLANIFAKMIQCEDKSGSIPCLHCSSCNVFDSGNHPDVIYVVPTKRKAVGIDDIRTQVLVKAATKPYKYSRKVFIIENADTLTAEAQNSLLKTLEEPPEYVVFIMTAVSARALLPTVLSRSVILKTEELPAKEISKYLAEKLGIPEDKASFYGEYARGSIGEAVKLSSSEEFSEMHRLVFDILASARTSDITTFTGNVSLLEKYKQNPEFLDIFTLFYRDLMIIKLIGNTDYIIQKDKADFLTAEARKETSQNISDKLEAVLKAKKELASNVNFNLCVELMLMKIKEKTT
ncbi:MAG: DNA polymerase III subunit [Firmicutes bacterium]|nr:DNA polymerase III subunit [Bacillota bacterium]